MGESVTREATVPPGFVAMLQGLSLPELAGMVQGLRAWPEDRPFLHAALAECKRRVVAELLPGTAETMP